MGRTGYVNLHLGTGNTNLPAVFHKKIFLGFSANGKGGRTALAKGSRKQLPKPIRFGRAQPLQAHSRYPKRHAKYRLRRKVQYFGMVHTLLATPTLSPRIFSPQVMSGYLGESISSLSDFAAPFFALASMGTRLLPPARMSNKTDLFVPYAAVMCTLISTGLAVNSEVVTRPSTPVAA